MTASVFVMPGLDPGIHPFKKMDCRVEPGNDALRLDFVKQDCATLRSRKGDAASRAMVPVSRAV
jgi:hypothetical protein